MKNFRHFKTIIVFFAVISVILATMPACSSGPENELEGDWALDWLSSGSENLFGDLNFGEGKMLTLSGSYV